VKVGNFFGIFPAYFLMKIKGENVVLALLVDAGSNVPVQARICADRRLKSERSPVLERTAKRHFVGKLKVAAHGKTACRTRHLDTERLD